MPFFSFRSNRSMSTSNELLYLHGVMLTMLARNKLASDELTTPQNIYSLTFNYISLLKRLFLTCSLFRWLWLLLLTGVVTIHTVVPTRIPLRKLALVLRG